jgi:O-acetyl-ADP-ribose deacetylase (regulator of RNase III)
LARHHQAKSIAFPAISTGVYGFPAERAARIAIESIIANAEGQGVEVVKFVCFDENTLSIYKRLLPPG